VSFERAIGAFYDPFAVEIVDTRADYGEERNILIGQAGLEHLTVVYGSLLLSDEAVDGPPGPEPVKERL
jgi:uncharacterized DUF497 family protein